MRNQELYESIWNFDIDGGSSALTFSMRLARENGWSRAYAERVVAEYKKFAYLARVAGHPVTPSDEVDQAWHLHMLYTESYWKRFCGGVLGTELSHGPTRGGRAEGEKFTDWYERTLASYRDEFGAEAPSDVWPPSEVRFDASAQFVRVNMSENIVLPRRILKRSALFGALLVAALTLGGCTYGILAAGVVDTSTVLILGGFCAFVIVLIIVAVIQNWGNPGDRRNGSTHGSGGNGSIGCTPSDSSSHFYGSNSVTSDSGGSWGGDSSGDSGGHSGCGGSSGCGSSCGGGCGGGGGD